MLAEFITCCYKNNNMMLDIGPDTERLMRQMGSAPIVDTIVETGTSRVEAIAGLVSGCIDTYFVDQPIGMIAHGLTLWHTSVKGICSDTYRQLSGEMPTVPGAEINSIPQLQVLNGIRQGLNHVRKEVYGDIKREKAGNAPLHHFYAPSPPKPQA